MRGMFFMLSKTLDLMIDPLSWVLGLLAAGLVAWSRSRERLGKGLVVGALLVTAVAGLPTVATTLEASLEHEAPNTMRSEVTYDVVILLGGVVHPDGSLRDAPAWNESIERLMTTWSLLHTNRARNVIVSGGELGDGLHTEADYLAAQLIEWGIDPARIIIENKANNTRENATLTQAIVKERGFKSVLVLTSAFHLPRALGCFRAVGLEVDSLAVDYRMRDAARNHKVLPRAESFAMTGRVVRERFGTLVYRLMGYAK